MKERSYKLLCVKVHVKILKRENDKITTLVEV